MSKQCVLRVDKRLFPQEAIFKAAYHFVDRYYIYLSCSDEHTVAVSIEDKGHCDLTDIDKQFGNELIAQVVRYNISQSNRDLKELILGRALYSAVYDTEEITPAEESSDYIGGLSLEDIAVDWFDEYGTNN